MGPARCLVLDGVQDPGNVGTMLRTAWALGAAGVIALKGTAELNNPKVLRGSMGGSSGCPLLAVGGKLLAWLAGSGVEIWVAEEDGRRSTIVHPRAARPPVALVVGNEGAGMSPALAAWAGPGWASGSRRGRVAQRGGGRGHSPPRGDA